MRVPYDKGVANHIGPESCVCDRKVSGEALTGESAGQVLSRENGLYFGEPTASQCPEGNMGCVVIARNSLSLRGRRPWARTEASCTGTGRSHARPRSDGPGSARRILSEQGRDVRAWEVGQANSTWEAAEQGQLGCLPAEAAEGRGLAKGNLFRQNKHRTLCRTEGH